MALCRVWNIQDVNIKYHGVHIPKVTRDCRAGFQEWFLRWNLDRKDIKNPESSHGIIRIFVVAAVQED